MIDVPDDDRCKVCGGSCCNCDLCVQLKRERDICQPCLRARAAAAGG